MFAYYLDSDIFDFLQECLRNTFCFAAVTVARMKIVAVERHNSPNALFCFHPLIL